MRAKWLILLGICICMLDLQETALAYKLPETGQILCYDSSGTVISCTGTGQDGAYNVNIMDYTDEGNGTVTDNVTGLIWQKCTAGQNALDCSGTATNYNWSDGQSFCDGLTLGDYGDWRLPTKKELQGLVNFGIAYPGPTINDIFAETIATWGSYYWTSTSYASSSDKAWSICFWDGGNYFDYKDEDEFGYVRCVRGNTITPSFTNNSYTVTDHNTHLIWQKAESGTKTWKSALDYCKNLTLSGYADWRLPNVKELESMSSDTLYSPAVDETYFPSVVSSEYWASTTDAYGAWTALAWIVDFTDGSVFSNDSSKNLSRYVRCVRAGGNCFNYPVKLSSKTYGSIQEAYSAAVSGQSLLIQQKLILIENLSFKGSKTVYLVGGYNCSFSARSGFSYLYGQLTIGGTGKVIADRLAIR
jgi:hypothetical protein